MPRSGNNGVLYKKHLHSRRAEDISDYSKFRRPKCQEKQNYLTELDDKVSNLNYT